MTPEQQRIAIAEACGWTEISDWGAGGINGKHPKEPWTEVIPDYLNDLNAMHEAEKGLNEDQQKLYVERLMGDVHNPISDYCQEYMWDAVYSFCLHATAAQRAEAFLRTLSLWKP